MKKCLILIGHLEMFLALRGYSIPDREKILAVARELSRMSVCQGVILSSEVFALLGLEAGRDFLKAIDEDPAYQAISA